MTAPTDRRRPLRRVFRWLIVPVVAMGAGCEGKRQAAAPPVAPAATPTAAAAAAVAWEPSWPMTRGGAGLPGRVAGPVLRQPVVEWTYPAGAAITSEAAVAEGLIVVGDADGGIHAVEQVSGQRRWRIATGDAVEATPAIAAGRVFAGSNDGVFRALDARDGRELWKLTGGEKFPTGAVLTEMPGTGAPVVLVNGYDGVSQCLAAATGAVVWRHETNDFINGSPLLLDGGRIAFGGCDARVHILRLADGGAEGELPSDAQIIRSLTAWGTTLYGVNHANQLFAAEWNAAAPAWVYEADETQFLTSPAADGERLYVGCRDKCLYAVDRLTGKRCWQFKTGGRVGSAPLVFDDAVVFGSSDGRLYAVAKTDGTELWRLELGEDLAVAPAYAGGRVVIGGGDGTVFVIRAGTPP